MLLKDGKNDPLQKANLIKEIVHSVSLIPDHITRSVYAKELSTHFDMEEQIVNTELARLRKNTLAKQHNEPEYRNVPVVNEESTPQHTPVKKDESAKLNHEFELIRLMLQFGTREIEMDNEGTEVKTKLSVLELVCQELNRDALTFTDPNCREIHEQFALGISENMLYSSSHFKHLENQDIVKFVSNLETIESDLSPNWLLKHNIHTKREEGDLNQTVLHSIYNFKYHKVNLHILNLQEQLKQKDLSEEDSLSILTEQLSYEKVKRILADLLGRTILS